MSTRPWPVIAPPVSCTTPKRRTGTGAGAPGVAAAGSVVSIQAIPPFGTSRASIASERPGVSGTWMLPSGPSSTRRKKV